MMTSKVLLPNKIIEMLSLTAYQEILNKARKKYSEAEIKIIRKELTKLSRVEYELYLQNKRNQREEETQRLLLSYRKTKG
jgi:hypothetical protein